jgi:hypothetical protein
MYNYLDYRADRNRIRERFVQHSNRKSSLDDIGGLLDEWVLDSKAATKYWQPAKHLLEQPC